MPFQFSTAARNASLDAIETAIGASPVLRIRTGAVPANPAAARTGTILAEVQLPANAWGDAANGSKVLNVPASDVLALATGQAAYFEVMQGATCHLQGIVSAGWMASTAYAAGATVHANGNVYRATVGGTTGTTAPGHTSGTATDGGVTWEFVQVGTDMTLPLLTIVEGQPVRLTALTLNALGA